MSSLVAQNGGYKYHPIFHYPIINSEIGLCPRGLYFLISSLNGCDFLYFGIVEEASISALCTAADSLVRPLALDLEKEKEICTGYLQN